jgi:hypothetical protein
MELFTVRPMKAYMRRGTAPLSLTEVLDGGELLTSRPGCFTAGNHRVGVWFGPRASLDVAKEKKKSFATAGIEIQFSVFQPVA